MFTIQTQQDEVIAIQGRHIEVYQRDGQKNVLRTVLRGSVGDSPFMKTMTLASIPKGVRAVFNGKCRPDLKE